MHITSITGSRTKSVTTVPTSDSKEDNLNLLYGMCKVVYESSRLCLLIAFIAEVRSAIENVPYSSREIKRSLQRTFKRHIEERRERDGRTVTCRRVNGKVKRQRMKREKKQEK
jgi:hypothetical protein